VKLHETGSLNAL